MPGEQAAQLTAALRDCSKAPRPRVIDNVMALWRSAHVRVRTCGHRPVEQARQHCELQRLGASHIDQEDLTRVHQPQTTPFED